jgi:uncharacterized protein (DUF924 family)
MEDHKKVLDFWITEVGPENWYNGPAELDDMIRQRFMKSWNIALDGGLSDWTDTASGCLAYLILTDQFPRNMFRDDARAFATDPLARSVATNAIEKDFDLQVGRAAQEFFYLPFEHSEDIANQRHCIEYISARMTDNEGSLLHAQVHQEIIRTFGRFPFRNKALNRQTTKEEQAFLDQNGYQGILKRYQNQSKLS